MAECKSVNGDTRQYCKAAMQGGLGTQEWGSGRGFRREADEGDGPGLDRGPGCTHGKAGDVLSSHCQDTCVCFCPAILLLPPLLQLNRYVVDFLPNT